MKTAVFLTLALALSAAPLTPAAAQAPVQVFGEIDYGSAIWSPSDPLGLSALSNAVGLASAAYGPANPPPGYSGLASTSYVAAAVSPLASTQALALAVAPLASTQSLAAAVAPLASAQSLAAAVAPLVSTQQLDAAVAPLATTQQLAAAFSLIPAASADALRLTAPDATRWIDGTGCVWAVTYSLDTNTLSVTASGVISASGYTLPDGVYLFARSGDYFAVDFPPDNMLIGEIRPQLIDETPPEIIHFFDYTSWSTGLTNWPSVLVSTEGQGTLTLDYSYTATTNLVDVLATTSGVSLAVSAATNPVPAWIAAAAAPLASTQQLAAAVAGVTTAVATNGTYWLFLKTN